MYKGILQLLSPWLKGLFFLLIAVTFTLIGTTLYTLIAGDGATGSVEYLQGLQWMQTVALFLLPTFLCSYLFSEHPLGYLSLDHSSSLGRYGIVLLLLVISTPWMNAVIVWNQSIVLPHWLAPVEAWMQSQETIAQTATEKMLQLNSLGELLGAILLIAVAAAVGEELFFRGVVQRILSGAVRNPHWVIWITAFIFSAVHLQFYGFVPRLLLGALFGYLLYWSGSIYLPIFAHFFNNLVGVVSAYAEQRGVNIAPLEAIGTRADGTLWVAGVALLLSVVLLLGMKRHSQRRESQSPLNFPAEA